MSNKMISKLVSEICRPEIGLPIIFCILFVVIMRIKGLKKYDLHFFISDPFLKLGPGSLVLMALLGGGFNQNKVYSAGQYASTLVIITVFLTLMATTFHKNVKQSDVLFGAFYTLAQIIAWMMLFLTIGVGSLMLLNPF